MAGNHGASLADGVADLNGALASGAEAAAHVAYGFSDLLVLQPSVDGAEAVVGAVAGHWRKYGRKNGAGRTPQVVKLESTNECTGAQLVSHAEHSEEDLGGAAVLTGSTALVKMVPTLYKLAASKQPCVVHVGAARMNTVGSSVESDFSDVAALRETGVGLLAAGTPQEAHDMALVAHIAALKTGLPMVNFWDGARVTTELGRVQLLAYDKMMSLVTPGTAAGSSTTQVLEHVFEHCAEVLGKHYAFFEYEGPANAEAVVVALGSPARVLQEAVRAEASDKVNANKSRVGVLRVRVMRPWSSEHLLAALPRSTRRVCVIDQHRSGEHDTPLFKDVAAAFHSDAQRSAPVLVSGNVVVNNKSGFSPAIAHAVIANLLADKPLPRFTLGDLTVGPRAGSTSSLVRSSVSWTIGSRAREARHALAVVLGPFLSLHVQQVDSTSAKTAVSRSDLRFAPFELTAEYPVEAADVIAVDDLGVLLLPHCDVLAQARAGTKLVLNCAWTTAEQAHLELGAEFCARLAQRGVRLFTVDASGMAPGASAWVMQACVAQLAQANFVGYKQVFSQLSKVIHRNAAGAASFVDALAEEKIEASLREVDVPADKWAAEGAPSGPEEEEEHGVPFDLLPSGLVTPEDGSAAKDGAPAALYHNLLSQLFGERLVVADTTGEPVPAALQSGDDEAKVRRSLESCYGAYLVKAQARKRLVDYVQRTISAASGAGASKELLATLGIWHASHDNAVRCAKVVPHLVDLLAAEKQKSQALEYVYNNRSLLHKSSKWIIGGDNWAYDLSNSGIRHIIASGLDVNVLVLDTEAYASACSDGASAAADADESAVDLNTSAMSVVTAATAPAAPAASASSPADGPRRRKKDIGLYAMNYGTAYVASVSALASQSQAMRALTEADAFKGPSIVLAHAPRLTEALAAEGLSIAAALGASDEFPAERARIASEAVEAGAWPLYRWNPAKDDQEFTLDSTKLKAEIQEFVKREQNLSLLASAKPQLPAELADSFESKVAGKDAELRQRAEQRRLNEQFDQLVDGVGGGGSGNRDLRLLVLFGSDGGNASGVAEKLAVKVEGSGCGEVRCMEANDFDVDTISEEKNVVLVLATAGQGEPCANAKTFTERLLKYPNKLPGVKFAVFGLGDSHYWGEGTADSARYFCLNAREVDARLAELGAQRLVPCALGDDQHDDGYDGALNEFEPALWEALDVKIKGGTGGGAPEIVDDDIKIKSQFLRGMIDEGLADLSTGKLLPEDTKLTKFHGIYQQDLRSVREELDAKGLERAYSFMIRIGVPGGVASSEQYIAMDELCTKYANGALKLTTRQAYQFHGVLKRNLKTTMKGINRALMDTLAACGDVNRNVIANPHHRKSAAHEQVTKLARDLQAYLRPKTSAYAEIWLDKKPVAGSVDHEPIYGVTYLPRKFKIAIAVPPLNDVDVFAHCLGYIAIISPNGSLLGFNVTVGGGMGTTHGNKKTYPRLSDVLGFCTLDQAIKVAESVVIVQRDHGDRDNRKHARLKYTVEDMGLEVFRAKVEALCGFKLGKEQPFKFDTNADPYGWAEMPDGSWNYTMFVEHGYVKDTPTYKIKTALREIAEAHVGGEMSLTATQNIIIGKISPERKPQILAIMQKYGIDNEKYSAMRLHSMACVALPTCALAMAESQTYLPSLITKIEATLDECGLRHDAVTVRMTGCPNGCGRPTLAEIGFIGKAPGQYNLYLGGGFSGNRISKMYREGVNEEEILAILGPMLRDWANRRQPGEHFGDFCIRTGIIEPTMQGRFFWSHGEENKLETATGSTSTQIYW